VSRGLDSRNLKCREPSIRQGHASIDPCVWEFNALEEREERGEGNVDRKLFEAPEARMHPDRHI
jgi:hypothetical protein